MHQEIGLFSTVVGFCEVNGYLLDRFSMSIEIISVSIDLYRVNGIDCNLCTLDARNWSTAVIKIGILQKRTGVN